MKRKWFLIITIAIIGFIALTAQSCTRTASEPESTGGVQKVIAEVVVQASGMTVEQENINKRIGMENMPGAVKHLYLISAYSGQVILYSTVKGKVTSSGKRLTPYTVAAMDGEFCRDRHEGFAVKFSNTTKNTGEVLQDDGTYGSSIPYLYWWDVQDRYHQHYVSGGQIIHISDKPIPGIKSVIINTEAIQ